MSRKTLIRCGVIGLDLSLTAAAAVCLPAEWSPREPANYVTWQMFGRDVEGRDPEQCALRLHEIARGVLDFVRQCRSIARQIYVEDYTFAKSAHAGNALAEGGGAVKAMLAGQGYIPIPVNVSTARAYLFAGKSPTKDKAVATHAALERAGLSHLNHNVRDALVVASYGRTEHGMEGLVLG